MPHDGAENDERPSAFSFRALALGLILIPLLIFWVEYTESVANGPDLAAMSLPMSAIFALMVLIPLNLLAKRYAPKLAFDQGELLLVYSMSTIGVYIGGIGMMQFLHPTLVGWYYFATPVNEWNKWFPLVRTWAVPDPSVIADYYAGKTSFFTPAHMAGWARPILVWSTFIFVLLYCFYCISTLFRKQWIESERLVFPIVQIPLAMTADGGSTPLWSNKLFWIGAVIPMVLESMAAIHYTLVPTLPYVPLKPEASLQIDKMFNAPPWNAIGYTTLSFYPLVIGLTYLLSLDVSFSCWFFYLVQKVELVSCSALGLRDGTSGPSHGQMPYTAEQSAGAFLALAASCLWITWPHLKRAWVAGMKDAKASDGKDAPMSYRSAYVGLIASALFLVVFGTLLGLSPVTSVLFFALFLLMALAFTRIRAEAGLPWAQGPAGLAHGTLINCGGTQSFGNQELVAFAFLQWFDSDWRCMPQTAQIEAMKMATVAKPNGINGRLLTIAMMSAVVVGTLAAWGSCLGIYYHFGATSAVMNTWRTNVGHYQFDTLQGYFNASTPMNTSRMMGVAAGFAITAVLSAMRMRFPTWSLHPIGFAVGNTDTMTWIWFSMLIGWAAKSGILRYGGANLYRQALPFFIGLVLGDYGISALWSLWFLILGTPGYRTFPI